MKVELIDYTGKAFDSQEKMLDYIASQSRNIIPIPNVGLFERTVDWKHKTIQEFGVFIFHLQDVSRVLLSQLTRHRIACFNVQSGRHNVPDKCVIPSGIKSMHGMIELENEYTYQWTVQNGEFKLITELDQDAPALEDLRYGFPEGTCVSIFMGINGSSLRNFLTLRMEKHAQWEIRELANRIYTIVKSINPIMVKGLDTKEKTCDNCDFYKCECESCIRNKKLTDNYKPKEKEI